MFFVVKKSEKSYIYLFYNFTLLLQLPCASKLFCCFPSSERHPSLTHSFLWYLQKAVNKGGMPSRARRESNSSPGRFWEPLQATLKHCVAIAIIVLVSTQHIRRQQIRSKNHHHQSTKKERIAGIHRQERLLQQRHGRHQPFWLCVSLQFPVLSSFVNARHEHPHPHPQLWRRLKDLLGMVLAKWTGRLGWLLTLPAIWNKQQSGG